MLMVNTGRKILQYNEERLPFLLTILQEIIEKIESQELRCKILNCLLSAKFNIGLKGLDGVFQIDSKTGKEVQCLLDELFTFDEAFMAKLTISEQNAMKEHICEMKQLILKDHVKVRQAYLDEGARKACIAEFNDVAKSIVGEVNKSFLALIAEKLSGNNKAERHHRTTSTSTISSPILDTNPTEKKVESGRCSSQEVELAARDALSKRRLSSSKSAGKEVESGLCNSQEVELAAPDALSKRRLSSGKSTGKKVRSRRCNSQEVELAARDALSKRRLSSSKSAGKKVESGLCNSQEVELAAPDALSKRRLSSGKSTGKKVRSRRCNSQEVGLAARDALSKRKLYSGKSSYLLRNSNSEKTTTSPSRDFPRTRSRKDLDETCKEKTDCFTRNTEKLTIAEKRVELLYELYERGKKLDKSTTRRLIRRTEALGDRDKKLESGRRTKKNSIFARSDCNSIGNYGVTTSGCTISDKVECETEECIVGNKAFDGKSKNACEIAENKNEDRRILLSDESNFTQRTFKSSATFNRDQCPVEEIEHTRSIVDLEAATEGTKQKSWNKPLDSCTEQEQTSFQHLSSLGITVDEYIRVTNTLSEPAGENHSRRSDVPTSWNTGRRSKEDDARFTFSNQNKRSYASMELFESTDRNKDEYIANFKRNDDKIVDICPVNGHMGDDASCRSVKLRHDHLGQRHQVVASGIEFSVKKAGLESTIKKEYNDTEASTESLKASASSSVVSFTPRTPVHGGPQQDGDIDKSPGNVLGNAARSLLSSIERAKRTSATEATSNGDAVWKEEQCSCVRHESHLHAGCQHNESASILSDLASKLLVLDGLLRDIKYSTAFDTSSEDSPSPVEETVFEVSQKLNSCSAVPETYLTDRVERLHSVSLDRSQCYPTQRHDSEGELEMRADGMDLEEAKETHEPYDATSRKKSTDCMQNDCLDSEVANESFQLAKGMITGIKADDMSEGLAFRDVFTISDRNSQNPGSVVDVFNEKRERASRKEEKQSSVAEKSKKDEATKKILDFIDLTLCDSSNDNCELDFDVSDPLGQSLSQMDVSEELSACSASPIEKKQDVSKWNGHAFGFDDISPEKEDRYDKFAKDKNSRFPACINISSNCSFSLQLDRSPSPSFQS